tara:strand:- start:369 stop:926 length:558 start_codon:yes stop_codon:yes gene_type:complete
MLLKLIQSSETAINSVYILEDFLDNTNHLNFLCEKIRRYTTKDEMNHTTNVKASMTSWKKLLTDNDFDFLHKKILETLFNIFLLRTPHPSMTYTLDYKDSWGMSHEKGNFTHNHTHINCVFSGAFYFRVPCFTEMVFDDYEKSIELKDNMLLLFPALCKHKVGKHTSDEKRISMAFNIDLNESPN